MAKWKKISLAFIVLVVCYFSVLLHFYIPDKQYHCNREAGKKGNCGENWKSKPLIEPKNQPLNTFGWSGGGGKQGIMASFHQTWLEVADDGFLWDGEQLAEIKKWIDQRHAENQPVFLVFYVHGWQNNADESSPENQLKYFPDFAARFADTTKRLAEADKIAKAPAVLAVWVGWHGLEFRNKIVGHLGAPFSFPSRAKKAAQIGEQTGVGLRHTPSLRSAFDQIANASVMKPEFPNDRMLVIGHSFGGRMLVHAFAHGDRTPQSAPYGPHALIVTVNAAVDGKCVEPIMEAGAQVETKWPTWINVVSSDDVVRHKTYKWASIITIPFGECGSRFPSFDRSALGFRKNDKIDYVFKDYYYLKQQTISPREQFSDFAPLIDSKSPISSPYCAYDKNEIRKFKSNCQSAEIYRTHFDSFAKTGSTAITIKMNKNFICELEMDSNVETCDDLIGFHSAAFQTGLARLYLSTLYGHTQ